MCTVAMRIENLERKSELHVFSFSGSPRTGFSGCHRYEAHQRLGLPTIRCKIRRGTKETLRFSFMFHFLDDCIFLIYKFRFFLSIIVVQASPPLSEVVVLN